MDARLAKGLAKRLVRECSGTVDRLDATLDMPRTNRGKGWMRAVVRDAERAIGRQRITTSIEAEGKRECAYIPFLAPAPPTFTSDRYGPGLNLMLLRVDPKARETIVYKLGVRVSQHAIERLIQRANLYDLDVVLDRFKSPVQTIYQMPELVLASGEVHMSTRDGFLRWVVDEDQVVAVTLIGKDRMNETNRAMWETAREANGHSLAGAH